MWFSYDPDGNGMEFHNTEIAAKAASDRNLTEHEDLALDGWSEQIWMVCWGKISEIATVVSQKPAGPGSKFDELIEYEMKQPSTTK